MEKPNLTQTNPIDTASLAEDAAQSKHKETYHLLEKNQAYRIGVGARAKMPTPPSFFVEAIINMATDGEVNLIQLERILQCLKTLKDRGYTLTYEDGNCISCETTTSVQDPNKEYQTIKMVFKTLQI